MSEAILRRLMKRIRIDEATGCWMWVGTKSKSGYGLIRFKGRRWRVHRLMYLAKSGEFPESLKVCHRCDVPLCCNPAHLFLGTDADNIADRDAKGRMAKGDRHGARIHRANFAESCKRRAAEKPDSYCPGEKNGRAKLTAVQVAEIRARYAAGNESYKTLGDEFGVDKTSIARIVKNSGWRT